jgi:hypothetical protein
MDDKTLKSLRPIDGSSAAISHALDRIAAETHAAAGRQKAAQDKARQMLLTGSTTAVQAAEAAAVTAGTELAQLAALRAAWWAEHPRAVAQEAVAAVQAQAGAAAAAVRQFNEWVGTDYVGLAEQIAAGLELERTALRLTEALRDQSQAAHRLADAAGIEGVLTLDVPPMARAYMSAHPESAPVAFVNAVQLPAASLGIAIARPPSRMPRHEGAMYAA